MADDILQEGVPGTGAIEFETNVRIDYDTGEIAIGFKDNDSSWCVCGDSLRTLCGQDNIYLDNENIDSLTFYSKEEIKAMKINNNDNFKFYITENCASNALVQAKHVTANATLGEAWIRVDSSNIKNFKEGDSRGDSLNVYLDTSTGGIDSTYRIVSGIDIYYQIDSSSNHQELVKNLSIQKNPSSNRLYKNYPYLISDDANYSFRNALADKLGSRITAYPNTTDITDGMHFWIGFNDTEDVFIHTNARDKLEYVTKMSKASLENFLIGGTLEIIDNYSQIDPDVPHNPK
jgi:hypothetical protein